MGVQEMALMLLGIGLISERFGGGKGLISLGTGIQTLIAAPLTGTGTGLTSLAGGLRDIFETFGDLGRGISALFAGIPLWALPGYVGPGGAGSGLLPPPGNGVSGNGNGNGGPPLIAMGGGDDTSLLPGGGGNVPPPGYFFSLAQPSAYVTTHYDVYAGFANGGIAGWWISNSPTNDTPTGGGYMV